MIAITPHEHGSTITVRVQPGAKKNAILGEHGGMLKVAVTAPPLDGRANEAVIELLAEWIGAKRSYLEILRGQTNRTKVILFRTITPTVLAETIESQGA